MGAKLQGWTKEKAVQAGKRVWQALGYWPSRSQWKRLAKEAAEAGEPLPTLWYIQKLFGGILPFGQAVGAIPEEEPQELPPLSELLPEERSPEIVTERRIPLPTPLGACTYIFSLNGWATAIIIDLIPPEPEWEFDRVTIIPWGQDGRTRELTQRFSGAEYLQHKRRALARLEALAPREDLCR